MGLLNLLFGKKQIIKDNILGTIESARIRGENPDRIYSWYAGYLMPNAPEESSIILEGNNKKPNPKQLNEVKTILKNLEGLWSMVDHMLNEEAKFLSISEREVFRNWKTTYYLGAIHPLDNVKPHFEICFDTIDSESRGYMIFSYRNGKLEEMEIRAPK